MSDEANGSSEPSGHPTQPVEPHQRLASERTTIQNANQSTEGVPVANTGRLKPVDRSGDNADEHAEELRRRILARIEEEAEAQGPDPLIGELVGGRFTVTDKIGEGGMGVVYKARQKGMDRDVAIKVLLKQMTENATIKRRFTLEALAVSKLKHPNTIQIFDFGDTPAGELYIAMEFLDGQSLQDRLEERGALPVSMAVKVAIQMTKSLREAHSKGIVHRDLKPDNIFLTTVGEEPDFVKVLDFGVAKLRETDEKQATLTKAGAVFGTPRYMSPEQGTASGSVDHRSDLYAIGVILFEMCTGRAPFDAENALGILIKHLQEEVPSFFDTRPDLVIPEEIELFTRRLLEKQPENRPQTAEVVIRELEKLAAQLDDIYRRVVTSDYAEAVGIEVNRSRHTRADTRLNTGAGEALLQTDAGDNLTVYNPGSKRSRLKWLAAAATVLLALSGGVGVYAMLPPISDEYRDSSGDIGLVKSDVSEAALPAVSSLPELQLVSIRIDSAPRGATVYVDKSSVGKTPYTAARLKDAGASIAFKVLKAGFQEQILPVTLDKDTDTLVSLKPNGLEVIATPRAPVKTTKPEPAKKRTISKKKKIKPSVKPVTASTPPVTKKKKKKNPFGASIDGIKD